MMNKIKISLLVLLPFCLDAQNIVETNVNFSNIQVSQEFSFRKIHKHFNFNVHSAYGVIGAKKFSFPDNVDGYDGVFNELSFGNKVLTGFKHQLIGFKFGAGVGYVFNLTEKSNLITDFNLNFYVLTDHYHHYYSSPTATSEKTTVYKTNTASADLTLTYIRELSNRLGLKAGVAIPFILPTINNNKLYKPSYKMPLSGIEPYGFIGIQFKLVKS